MTIFEADWICPISSAPIRDGCLAVDDGKISSVGQGIGPNRIGFPGCAIIPGFVNAHAHLELTILRGFLEDLPFATWIPRLTRAKYQQLTRDDMLVSARLGAIEMLRAGVTCVAEVMDLGTGWQAMQEFELQGIAYQEVFGPAESQAAEAIAGLQQKIDICRRNETETRRIGVSPHAPYTVSPKLFQAVNEYTLREKLQMTSHVAESKEEGLLVRHGSGPFAERLRERGIPFAAAGCSPIAYLDRFGLVRPEMLLIHAVDLDDTDFDILRQRGPAVAHCPKSNAKLAHGVAPLPEIRETGIRLSLGTDSVASNNVVDMFEEMRAAIFQQRGRTQRLEALDAKAAFRMATLGGAECLGLGEHLGSLDAGKRADFVVVDLNDPAVQPVYDPIDAMVYSASRHNVHATYIGGKEMKIDAAEIVRECAAIADKLRTT
jgi:5-methylthioadenosine/S-adenosylhomocysteine deaminase